MRVLRLGLGDDHVVDLHPSASVVMGLSPEQRRTLRRDLSAIGTGLAPRAPGLLEAHGLLLDATQADLDLLGVPATPATTVVTVVEVPGALPSEDIERLWAAERDLVLFASDRWRSSDALTRAEETASIRPTHAVLRARAAELRSRIARHEARDAEPVRRALDRARDEERMQRSADTGPLVAALAGVGLDVEDLGLPIQESVRLAEDWLDERHHEAAWAVGAGVELRGIERALAWGEHRDVEVGTVDVDELRRRAHRAADAHVAAVDGADELRAVLADRHVARPAVEELERHVSTRLHAHRPDRLAGTVPMLLDGVCSHLDDPDVIALLDRVTGLAGSVQLIVVDDHPAARGWAAGAGLRRAAVVEPSARPVAGGPS